MTLTTAEVHAATDHLVEAFAATDAEAYFACFAPSASFVFYPEPQRLDDRAAYERVWQGWLESSWRVVSCESTDRLVQLHGDVAVLSHRVHTVTSADGEETATTERETIVFARLEGRLLAVHEHLSSVPEATA